MLSKLQRERIKKSFAPITSDPVETAKRTIAWGLYFFGDPENAQHFYLKSRDIPKVHWGIHLSLSLNFQYYYCTSPRSFAKTSHIRINTLYRIYNAMEPYILLIGKIDKSGRESLENIKYDIEYNPKLLEVYGDLKPKSRLKKWSDSEIQTENDIFVRSIGMMGNARSAQKHGWRFTLVMGDDVQDTTTMREPTTLESHRIFWEREVEKAIDAKYGKVRYVGNLLGKGCLLEAIMKDSRYKGTSFHALVKEDGTPEMLDSQKNVLTSKSTWETWWPTKKLHSDALKAITNGKRAVWLAENQNVITDDLSKTLSGYRFHHFQFKRHEDVQNVLIGPDYPQPVPVYTYLSIDPAFAKSKNADERALVVFAKGRIFQRVENIGTPIAFNCLWVLEYLYNFMSPTKIIDKALEWHEKYYFNSVFIETIGGQLIYKPMTEEKVVGNTFFSKYPYTPVFINYHESEKKGRIYTHFQPRMALGQVFIRPEMTEFQRECDNFDAIASPHLLDALEFGDRNSNDCVEDLFVQELRHERRRRELAENQKKDYRDWAPTNIGQLGVRS